MKNIYYIFIAVFMAQILSANFDFTFEPIDAVIPCHEKDKRTIDRVVEGIRKNVKNIGRIIVVSATPLTDKAEWFDERNFPFDKESIAYQIFKDKRKATDFLDSPKSRAGWILQQFLKTYSIFVIPDISSNVLIVDADTIFLCPVEFQDPQTGAGLYNPGTEYHVPYFTHIAKVLPGVKRLYPQHSGISHHMLFQRSVMEAIFAAIRKAHNNKEPWKVFCDAIDINELYRSCMCVEYELYFNYVFSKTDKVKIRHLKWANVPLRQFNISKGQGYHYLSCHTWMG